MNSKACFLLLILAVTFTFALANKDGSEAMQKAQQQKVFSAHAEVVEMGVLGKAAMGGPRLKLGRPQPPAHTHMNTGRL